MNKKVTKIIGIMSIILLATGCAFSQAQTDTPKNLLQNPGFENGLKGWANPYPRQITETTEAARGGAKAAKIDASIQNKSAFLVQTVKNIVGGAEYEFSAWARAPLGAKNGYLALKIETYSSVGGNTAGYMDGITIPADGSWHQVKIRKRLLGGTNECKLLLRCFAPNAVIIDDASLVMTSAAPELTVRTPEKAVVEVGKKRRITYELSLYRPWTGNQPPRITAHIAPQDEESGVGKSFDITPEISKVDDSHFNAVVSVPALEATNYTVTFALERDGKTYQTPYPAYLFTLPEKRRPAYLTETGTILRNGKSFFPIGMYHPYVQDPSGVYGGTENAYRLLAEFGFNAVQGGSPVDRNGNYNAASFKKSIDLAKKYGLAVDVPLYSRNKVKDVLDENLKAVKDYADDPTILSWKIYDEPLWQDIDGGAAAEVPGAYRALKAASPSHPIELTLPSQYNFWVNFCDIIQPDIYPVPRNEVSLISKRLKMVQEAALPWQNISVVLQSGWDKDLTTQPTAPQARSMVYQSLIHGAKGIWWYSMHEKNWDLTQSPLWPHFKDINAEVKVLSEPMMLGENVAVKSSNPKVEAGARKYQNKLYVLFTNPTKNEEKTELSLDGIKGLKEGTLLEAKKKVNVAGQKIALTLPSLQTDTLVFDLD